MALLNKLVSYWQFDEASGTTARDSRGSNTGTLTGTEAWVAGKHGNAFDFNQASHFEVGTSDTLNLTTAGSIVAWINPDDLGESSLGRIFDRGTVSTGFAFHLVSSTGNKLQFVPHGSVGSISTGTITFDTWQHAAVTWSGTGYKFYIDGAEAGSGTLAGAISSAVAATGCIGSRPAGDRDFDGKIDELGIWSSQLTAAEIATLYRSGRGLAYPFGGASQLFCYRDNGLFAPESALPANRIVKISSGGVLQLADAGDANAIGYTRATTFDNVGRQDVLGLSYYEPVDVEIASANTFASGDIAYQADEGKIASSGTIRRGVAVTGGTGGQTASIMPG